MFPLRTSRNARRCSIVRFAAQLRRISVLMRRYHELCGAREDDLRKMRMPCVFALALLTASPASPQQSTQHDVKRPAVGAAMQKTPNAGAPDPSADAKAAFLGMSEPDRKALQEGLGWLGFYNGVVDGAYGKRSIDSLSAYQLSLGATADGVIAPKQLAALKAAAEKAKAAVGFKLIDDAATGLRIGAPTKLLEKREGGAGFTSLSSNDGEIKLDLKETSGKLAALYKYLSADAPNHKFTYKVMKPDVFFVIAGEEGDKKFYRRYAAAPADAADPDKLRGFMFIYPKARAKALDPVALAVANAFDPFPTVATPTPVARVTPTPFPTSEAPKLTATALVVAPGVAVTTLAAAQCKSPTIDGKLVRFLDSGDGLARLGGDFGAGAAAPAVAEGGDDLVVLSLVAVGDAKPTLQVADATPVRNGGALQVVAALGGSATGAPLFDRQGRLVAFIAPIEAAKRRAGVVLAEPHATTSAAALGPGGAATEGPLSAPEIARLMRSAVVGVFCGA
jgi:Putative peptidoglycan binding domain